MWIVTCPDATILQSSPQSPGVALQPCVGSPAPAMLRSLSAQPERHEPQWRKVQVVGRSLERGTVAAAHLAELDAWTPRPWCLGACLGCQHDGPRSVQSPLRALLLRG